MSSEEEIRRYAQILLGVILTDPKALEELRGIVRDDPQALSSLLERLAGIKVPSDEADEIVKLTDEFVNELAKKVKHAVVHEFLIHVLGGGP